MYVTRKNVKIKMAGVQGIEVSILGYLIGLMRGMLVSTATNRLTSITVTQKTGRATLLSGTNSRADTRRPVAGGTLHAWLKCRSAGSNAHEVPGTCRDVML